MCCSFCKFDQFKKFCLAILYTSYLAPDTHLAFESSDKIPPSLI